MSAPVQLGPLSSGGGPAPSLTPIEMTVLQHVAAGLTRKQISEQVAYSPDGVLRIIRRTYRKLGAVNAPHAVLLACQFRILDPTRRHGDHPGFNAHKYRGEDPCQACRDGERAYRAERRRARKAQTSASRSQKTAGRTRTAG